MTDFKIEQKTEEKDRIGNDILQGWNEYQKEYLDNEWSECDNADEVLNLSYNLKDNGSKDFLVTWDNEIREYNDLYNTLFSIEFNLELK
jgi:hypothetical protein